MKCRYCNSAIMRRSRLRLSDLARLLLMFQYPIRCRYCHNRVHVWAHQAFKLKAAIGSREQGPDEAATESHETARGRM
jgi:DNA-directed RNA polymerase subunit RPC12/RpoP